MRTIKKQPGGNYNLLSAQNNNGIPNSRDEATKAWSNFKDRQSSLCYKLLVDQYGLCCYTELNLSDTRYNLGIGAHFEHEQPKSLYPRKTFDEENILRCILDSNDLSLYAGEEQFGGHYKGDKYNKNLFISPQSANCRDFFIYLDDGTVAPRAKLSSQDHERAEYTITTLNLNAPLLKAERERWIIEIKNEIDKLIDSNNGVHSLRILAECELTLTNRVHVDLNNKGPFPQLRSFHSATRGVFGSLGETVIKDNCHYID